MIVKNQKPIVLLNDCNCTFESDELINAIKWYSNKPVIRIKHIYMHGNYPAVTICKQKIHIHRLLMMYWSERKLQRNEFVHHIDGNKLNSSKLNLELTSVYKHQSHHNKGKKLSLIHKQKISEAGKKRKGIKMKKRVVIPEKELNEMLCNGKSINSIANHFNCDWSTVRDRIYENPELLQEAK